MVQTRRRVVSEKDRIGGYNSQPTAQFELDTELDSDSAITPARRFVIQDNRTDLKYSTIADYSVEVQPSPTVQAPEISYPKRERTPKRREREDLMPSIKPTIQEAKESTAKEKVKVSTKSKVLLCVYMAVVAVLAAVVIGVGVAVSNISGDVSKLQGELLAKNEYLNTQVSQIDKLTDKNYIAGAALNNGMEKIGETVQVSLVPVTEPITYESRTNWFDQFCDWISKIIGG